jgi:hypothetical protein
VSVKGVEGIANMPRHCLVTSVVLWNARVAGILPDRTIDARLLRIGVPHRSAEEV